MVVRIVPNDRSAPADKLADAEIIFEEGLLTGMKLVGFSIWRSHRRALFSVTFPARQFTVNGERRSYALLRPITPGGSQEPLRLCILQAFAEYEQRLGAVGSRSYAGAEAAEEEGTVGGISREGVGEHTAGQDATGEEAPREHVPDEERPADEDALGG